MFDGLTNTQMKLGWAYKRLNELKREIASFRADSYSITTKDNVEESRYCTIIEQKITPDAIGMLVGEFAYALRSGLDHLAWQLALLKTPDPGNSTAFPIDSQLPLPTNRSYRDKVADILPAALTVVDSLQPYTTGPAFKDHPLWQLNKLCNIDKHRVVAVGHIHFQVIVPLEFPHFLRRDTNDTIEICVPLADKAKFHLDVNCPGIVFGEPIDVTDAVSGFEISINELERIYDFVRNDAVPRFDRFFL